MGVNIPTQGRVLTGLHRAPYSDSQGAEYQGAYTLAVAARTHSGPCGGGWPAVATVLVRSVS
jgi:hypothetical protein